MQRLVLRLYVAGEGPNSVAARSNLRRMLSALAPDAFSLDIVDCLREPRRAMGDGVLVTPTLVRLEPAPRRTIVGTLSDAGTVCEALGLAADEPAAAART